MPARRITEQAPAKLNLTLRIVGKRADGYHLLESLVAFTTHHDLLSATLAPALSLTVTGEFAAEAGQGEDNLVLRAAHALRTHAGITHGAQLTLDKRIPVGAGLGGGSADAAAALRALSQLWELNYSMETLATLATPLGADVAMCLYAAPAIARGIGTELTPLVQPMPTLHLLLLHSRVPLLTAEVYRALAGIAHRVPAPTTAMETLGGSAAQWVEYLAQSGNDLEAPARAQCPAIDSMLHALSHIAPPAMLARMTGSGACCYGIYQTAEQAEQAAQHISRAHPNWWCCVTQTR